MTGWNEVDRDRLEGGCELVLYEREGAFMIRADGLELVTSTAVRSEEDFVRFGLDALGRRPERVLIGGLGLGFTLGAVARALPDAKITVVEISEAIIRWAKGPAGTTNAALLEDPRVTLLNEEVGAILDEAQEAFDLILLDVDNGPEALVHESNDGLYSADGIKSARDALTTSGVVVYWSAVEAPWFAERLMAADLAVTAHHMAMPDNPRVTHVHYVAMR